MYELIERSEYLKRLKKDGNVNDIPLRKSFAAIDVKEQGDNKLRFIISDGSIDRDNDTIAPDGWDLKNYRNNPVVLWAHNHREPPIGKGSNVFIEGNELIADAEFTPEDVNPFGHMIYQLYLGGFMKAVSVGFISDERIWSEEQGGIKFLTQELLEFSAVPVPANPNALQIARSAGIDVAPLKGWAEKLLDEWEDGNRSIGTSRKGLERIVKESAMKKVGQKKVSDEKQKELRQRNIWEPRIKEFIKSGEWDVEEYGLSPLEDECKIPEFLCDQYEDDIQEAIDSRQKKFLEDEWLEVEDNPLIKEFAVLVCGGSVFIDGKADISILEKAIGKEAIMLIHNTTKGSMQMEIVEQLNKDLELLKAESEELKEIKEMLEGVELVEGSVEVGTSNAQKSLEEIKDALFCFGIVEDEEEINYPDAINAAHKDYVKLSNTVEELTEERDQLLVDYGELLIKESESGVGPEKIVDMISNSLAKGVRKITGRVD